MAADPNSFDHFRRGEPIPILDGAADPSSFDHFRRGEPFLAPHVSAEVAEKVPRPNSIQQQLAAIQWYVDLSGAMQLRKTTYPWVADVPDDTPEPNLRNQSQQVRSVLAWHDDLLLQQWPRQRVAQQDVDNPPGTVVPNETRRAAQSRAVQSWYDEIAADHRRQRVAQFDIDNPPPEDPPPETRRAAQMRGVSAWYDALVGEEWPEQQYDRAGEFTVAAGVNATVVSGWIG